MTAETDALERDELDCRPSGPWARTKHAFLQRFGPEALNATLGARRPKRSAAYVDLYAGPGICVDRASQSRFFGSPLLATRLRSSRGLAFTEAHLVNKDAEQHAALEARIERLHRLGELAMPRQRIFTYHGDANVVVRQIMDRIHPRAYVLAIADPARPNDLPFSTIEALTRHRGHDSVDLYSLFPLKMALLRMLGYDPGSNNANFAAASRFFGDDSWQECMHLRANEDRSRDFRRCLTDVYIRRLRSLWRYAGVVASVRRTQGHELYRMCFASNHDAGERLAQWAKEFETRSAQGSLF